MAEDKDVPTWIKACIGVMLFAIAIWGVAWAAGSGNNAMSNTVSSNEHRISKTESKVEKLDEKVTDMTLMYVKQEAAQESLLNGQTEMKSQISEFNRLMMQKIESDAETKAWIKSIDKVNN